MAIDQPMNEGTLSQEMSEAILSLSLGELVQMFVSARKPVGATRQFRVSCGDASVMVTLEQEGGQYWV